MEKTVKERLIEFIEYKDISVREFERRCNLSYGYMKSLRHAPKNDKLSLILTAYPELNRSWLLTGEGEMLNGTGEAQHAPPPPKQQQEQPGMSAMLEVMRMQAESIQRQTESIYKQTESLAAKDRQIDELLSMLREQMRENKSAQSGSANRAGGVHHPRPGQPE